MKWSEVVLGYFFNSKNKIDVKLDIDFHPNSKQTTIFKYIMLKWTKPYKNQFHFFKTNNNKLCGTDTDTSDQKCVRCPTWTHQHLWFHWIMAFYQNFVGVNMSVSCLCFIDDKNKSKPVFQALTINVLLIQQTLNPWLKR